MPREVRGIGRYHELPLPYSGYILWLKHFVIKFYFCSTVNFCDKNSVNYTKFCPHMYILTKENFVKIFSLFQLNREIHKNVFNNENYPLYSISYYLLGVQLLLYPGSFNMTTGPAHWELMLRSRYGWSSQCLYLMCDSIILSPQSPGFSIICG